jgi:hypothetical protein
VPAEAQGKSVRRGRARTRAGAEAPATLPGTRERAVRRPSPRVLAARLLCAAGLALFALAVASAAAGDDPPPPAQPVEAAPATPAQR